MGYGTGTVYWNEARSRWIAAAETLTPTGQRKRKTFSARTRDGAESKLAEYRRANPSPVYDGRRASLDRARGIGRHTEAEWIALGKSVRWRCAYCDGPTTLASPKAADNHREKDHRIPLVRGGSDGIENIAVACHACNARKGRMTDVEFLAWSGR